MWHSLVPIWTVILGLGVFIYVSLDGFDLGVGMLHGLVQPSQRETVMNSIGPFWDGNETWLDSGRSWIACGISRRLRDHHSRRIFSHPDHAASAGVSGCGFRVPVQAGPPAPSVGLGRSAAARCWPPSRRAWCSAASSRGSRLRAACSPGRRSISPRPFALLTGVALVFGYALLGAGWLVMKTEGELQAWSRRAGRVCLVAVSLSIAAVSLWTPLASGVIAQRWFAWPNTVLLLPLPIMTVAAGFYAWRALGHEGAWQAFVASIALFALSFLGIAISLWPMIVPGHFTLWQAASPESTQAFPAGWNAGSAPGHPVLHRMVVLGVPRQGSTRRQPLRRLSARAGLQRLQR